LPAAAPPAAAEKAAEPARKDKELEASPKPAAPAAAAEKKDRHGVTPSQQKKIDDAILRGVQFLKSEQHSDGSWSGYYRDKMALNGKDLSWRGVTHILGSTALTGLTLLECGVQPIDPHILKAAAFVRLEAAKNTATYEISLAILFLDKLGSGADKPIIQALSLRLIKGQYLGFVDNNPYPDCGWNYQCPLLDNTEATNMLRDLKKSRPKPPPTAIDKSDKNPLPTGLSLLCKRRPRHSHAGRDWRAIHL
jgi:hypothetical protein